MYLLFDWSCESLYATRANNNILELEAESVAYVVVKHFGLNELSSPNYTALHGTTAKMILEHIDCIHNTATEIIHAIETESILKI
jgi:hypothetical protein